MKIDDGKGSGRQSSVTGRNELLTFSVIESETESANDFGLAYNLNSGEVTGITSGDATLLYYKNGEDDVYVITGIAVGLRGFTGMSDMGVVTIHRNPTGGDLVTDATDADINSNSNFGSSNILNAGTQFFKGKDSGTVTGGEEYAILYGGNNGRLFASLNIEVPKGASIAVEITSDATAGNAYCALIGHLKDPIRGV